MSIRVEIKNNIDKKLAAIHAAGLNVGDALGEIGQDLVSLVREGFRASQDPYGNKWEPLKLRKGKPLEDTGLLRQSFTAEVTGKKLVIGTNKIQAPVHQFGAVITPVKAKRLAFKVGKAWIFAKRVNIPARPMLPNNSEGFPDSWHDAIVGTIIDHINRGANAS